MASDPELARAYAAAEKIAQRVTAQSRIDPRLQALAAQALAEPGAGRHPVAGRWRIAAALLLTVGAAALLAARQGMWSPSVPAAVYANAGLQQQRVELPDGSNVYLDTGARLEVRLSKEERRLELRSGRAYFEVAHDAARPFSVTAQGVSTVALGTRFQVALAGRDVSVTLAEGSVAISDQASRPGWQERLQPGQQLRFSAQTGKREKREVDTVAALSWSRGRLVFDGTPLSEALEEINRYSAVKIHLGDQALASVPVGGNFVAGGDSRQVVDALATVLPLRAIYVGTSEIVLFQRYEKPLG